MFYLFNYFLNSVALSIKNILCTFCIFHFVKARLCLKINIHLTVQIYHPVCITLGVPLNKIKILFSNQTVAESGTKVDLFSSMSRHLQSHSADV